MQKKVGTVWYVLAEYEVGSSNGEVAMVVSAHRTEAGAEKACEQWKLKHECRVDATEENLARAWEEEDEYGEKPEFCPLCRWGVSYGEVQVED